MRSFRRSLVCLTGAISVASLFLLLRAAPAYAVDDVEFSCNGISGTTCDTFQLDGAANPPASADTCVGGEFACPSEEDPVWPADWDALLYPTLTGQTITPLTGSPPNAYTFSLPWGKFGSFSGIFTSALVSTGTSQILKQGSKNNADISTWVVASQASPPKDAYLAGALASYGAPTTIGNVTAGDELLYFSSTRFKPQGSAAIGLWLFQENVQVCPSGTALCVDGTTTVANHKDGDVFLFISYSGSGTATIQASKWNGNGTSGSLGSATALVTCPTAGDEACAITNELNSITLGKSATLFQAPGEGFNVSGPGFAGFANGVVPALQFEEGGIDLNKIFSGTAPCFSSVLFASVTSGSSPGTASLKSILLGSFSTCAISATKTCNTGTADLSGGTVTYPITGTVENTGGGAVTGLSLTDLFNGNPQAIGSLSCTCNSGCTITGTNCSTVTLNPGGTVTYNATITTSSNGGSDVITATMGGTGGGSASGQSNTATCNPLSFSDQVSITKDCTPGASLVAKGGFVAVQVDVSGNVTATTTGGLSLSGGTVYDCVGGTFALPGSGSCPTVLPSSCTGTLRTAGTFGSLSNGGTTPWSDTYNPSVAPTCGPYNFNDQVLVDATCSSAFCSCPEVQNVASKTCPLCPGPNCP